MPSASGGMRLAARVLSGLVVLALPAGCSASVVPASGDPALPQRLAGAVTGDGAYRHLQELERIADTNGGNRALGTPGYDASVD